MENNTMDEVYLNIFKEKKTFPAFLDSVFGFLYRCTDFYQPQDSSSSKFEGQGGALALVQTIFNHYEMQTQYEKLNRMAIQFSSDKHSVIPLEEDIPVACCEVEIGSEQKVNLVDYKDQLDRMNNEDDRTNYKWSQTYHDVEVIVNIPNTLKAKDLKIDIHPNQLKLDLLQQGEEWTTHISKTFPFRVNTSECMWSMIPGQHIHLEKAEKRWWDRLFIDDPPINVKLIDTAVPSHELSPEEHMKIEELLRKNFVK